MARSLSQKTLVIAAGTGIQAVLTQVAVNLFLVRIMDGPVAFGIYRQVWLVVNTALPVFLIGLDVALYFYFPSLPREDRRAFLRRTLGLLFASGGLLALLLWAASPLIASAFGAPEVAPLLHALAPYVLFGMPTMALFHFLIADDRAVLAVVYNIAYLVAQAALTVGLIAAGVDLETVFYTLGAFMALRLLHTLFEIRRLTVGSWRAPLPMSRGAHLRYALPIGFTATMGLLGGRIDKFVVASFLGPAVFASYSVGALEFPLVVLLASAAATVLRMKVSGYHHAGDTASIAALYGSASRKLALALIPLGVCLAVFAREIITLLYTEQYADATRVFRVYLLLSVFRLLPLEPLLSSLGRTREVFTGGAAFLALDIVLNLIAVHAFGVLGPPLATVAATAALTAYYGARVSRGLGVPARAFFRGRVFGRIALVSAAAAAASMPVLWIPWPAWGRLLAGLAAFGTAFLSLGLATRTVERGDLQILAGIPALLDARAAMRRSPGR